MATPDLSGLRLGTAPDSWGVWFPDDPQQVPWHRFLDEAAAAGYTLIELGPYGYLPTDPEQLRDELGSRGLTLTGGAVFAGLHRGADAYDQALADYRQEARLLSALGARHVIALPEQYTDMHGGDVLEASRLEPEQWRALTDGYSRLGRVVQEEFGLQLDFHSHADSHVGTQEQIERFLDDTDPRWVSLCLDTGHVAYYGGDNEAIVRKHPERIGYVHLKQVDPVLVEQVHREGLSFADAVRRGAMVEPPHGVPDMPPLLDALAGLDAEIFTIVEQDMYPCPPDAPLPIAERTARYLGGCGLGPVRLRP
ncbi:MAG: Inosose dehydratase [uncultured Frankineae bacterium]|uniref:Inosose dehydratase n=1 Tax=uncultured Frankineae bacterium TaxID=437475 RepID=A0A6J4KWH9_9ACTN|nr:MAG: Inosose dehydratase [uncultured Frankineae bacterium]